MFRFSRDLESQSPAGLIRARIRIQPSRRNFRRSTAVFEDYLHEETRHSDAGSFP